ncbi:gamma-glutamylcyclotransferase family protein [Flavisolibacter nicotianae]|uniref:gamma-glutamylcyclotransferase family protein n=1 Tax=Flavisolibacter nicotianae TaxID=2364882 RepID=UPI000EAB89C7|nr:gamma-glutamylcyclotransferase family protein [Flavisolibacter nicotianae]
MNEFLFSYGTLQNEAVQLALFGRRLHGTSDALNGYCVAAIEISDEAFLAKGEDRNQSTAVRSDKPNDGIRGMVFEITSEELLQADRYEPANYQRVSVVLASGKQAWLYMAKAE